MGALLLSFRDFDSFIKMQLLNIAITSFSWSLIIPIVTKLQGMFWAASLISAFLILNNLSSFICPFFKELSIRISYGITIILSFLYFISLPLYFIDPNIFLLIQAILMFLYSIIMSIFTINYDVYLMDKYKADTFKNIQYIERMVMSLSAIIGFATVAVIDLIFNDLGVSIKSFMFMLLISLIIEGYNYKTYWRDIN